MQTSPELIRSIEGAIAILESWQGKLIRVSETLVRSTGETWEYDRHGCTLSSHAMIIEHVGWRFSGGVIMILGALSGQQCSYEVSLHAVVAVRLPGESSVAVKERFGQAAERVSVFQLATGDPIVEREAARKRR